MKKIYLALFLVSSFVMFSQEATLHSENPRDNEIAGFKLYPNPAFDDFVYITTAKNAHKDIKVYDVFGEIVLRDRILGRTLNIAPLVPGVYVLQVTENHKTITRKLVVK